MQTAPDYALPDRLGLTWGLFFPRRDFSPPPSGATDQYIQIEAGVRIAWRSYLLDPAGPTLLLFHGNGEVASDYDMIAPAYHGIGVNLSVADYRGYGKSSGIPTFAALIGDAHPVLDAFHTMLDGQGFHGKRLIMGRSLGSLPAVELAATKHQRLAGLIIESGSADLARFAERAGVDDSQPEIAGLIEAHRTRIASISLPVLQIHGEWDDIIPIEYAVSFHQQLMNSEKTFVTIKGAGHNDIGFVGRKTYFDALARFIARV